MASKAVHLGINRGYAARYYPKRVKGQGIYADQLPGMPRGVHAARGPGDVPCRCGRCSSR
jgi:hypothetical protein